MPLHRRHLEEQAFVADPVARPRHPSEQREHEPADAVDILVLEVDVELLPDLVDPHRPRHAEPALRVPVEGRLFARILGDLADDLLEQILERQDACGSSVLVHDHGELGPVAPQRRELFSEIARATTQEELLRLNEEFQTYFYEDAIFLQVGEFFSTWASNVNVEGDLESTDSGQKPFNKWFAD